MLPKTKEEWESLKQVGWSRLTSSGCVSHKAGFLCQAIITSDGVGEADGALYNGTSTVDEYRLSLYTTDENMKSVPFALPAYFDKGLYVYVGSNVTEIVVRFIAEKGV